MLKAIIIDNEFSSIENLQTSIAECCPEVQLVGEYRTLDEGLRGIREKEPDVVFLDVELDAGITGFDLLEKIPNRQFEVIFVTAYNHYAIRAFHFSATHYLEKPIDDERLREAVDRVKKRRSENDLKIQMQVLSESLKNISSTPKQIILPNPRHGDSIVVSVTDVIRVEASGSQAIFFILWQGKSEKSVYSLNIGTLQKKMLQCHDDFIRIHESHIINCNHITYYNPKSHAVTMADGVIIRIADRRINEFLQKFNK